MSSKNGSLDVIGLISGGKDSFFSMLHCIANDHRVVALANLYPPEVESPLAQTDDLNSYMYQTAGHGLIPLYADALGLPLYRQEILGSALNVSKNYYAASDEIRPVDSGEITNRGAGDETESLVPLLKKVMAAHPTANAVCSGAILSTYQRIRIESVARRLDLIPLSYLWQYPSLPPPSPGGLLDEMAAVGFDVRIVKVASGGLDEGLLWSNLMERTVRNSVEKGLGRFGGSVLGEGGEYETLVIDGPAPFWKRRIEVRPNEKWVRSGGGGEAWIGFREHSGTVLKKGEGSQPMDRRAWKGRPKVPTLWDSEFSTLVNDLTKKMSQYNLQQKYEVSSNDQQDWEARSMMVKTASSLTLSNVTALEAGTTASDQMLGISSRLMASLEEYHCLNTKNVVFTTILLRSTTDFAPVNEIYGQLFTRPNPPARVTVACGDTLPPGVQVMVSFIVALSREQEGLHVQSRSYWAPANIGPYSQSISVPLQMDKTDTHLVYVAGQIPLVPASMEVLQSGNDDKTELFQEETCLALQHLWRIGQAMSVSWWTSAVAFIAARGDMQSKATVAWEAWKRVHDLQLWGYEDDEEVEEDEDEKEGLDAWDRKYGGLGGLAQAEPERHILPDFKRSPSPTCSKAPPFLAVEVDELPRGCDIEWQSSGVAYHDPSTSTVQQLFSCLAVPLENPDTDQDICTRITKFLCGRQDAEGFDAIIYTSRPGLVSDIGTQVVPCRSVWGPGSLQLVAGIIIRNKIDN